MNNYTFKYSEFLAIKEQPCKYQIDFDMNKEIFQWYNQHPDQKEMYKFLDVTGNYSAEDFPLYRQFGLDFAPKSEKDKLKDDDYINLDVIEADIRNYVIILEEEDLLNLECAIETFRTNYLPPNTEPTYFAVKKILKTNNEKLDLLYSIQHYIPGCVNLFFYNDLLDKENLDKQFKQEISDYISTGMFSLIDITTDVDAFENKSLLNIETQKQFKDLCDIVLNKVENAKTGLTPLLYYQGESAVISSRIFAIMKYFYNIDSGLFSQKVSMFRGDYSELLFSTRYQLVEQQIKYLLNFPTLSFKITSYGLFWAVTVSRRITSKVYLCPLNSISKNSLKIIENFVFNETTTIPVTELYDLNGTSNESDLIRSEHTRLLEDIKDLENAIGIKTTLLNLCNVFFTSYDGELCICYLSDLQFSGKALILNIFDTTQRQVVTMNLEDVRSYLPLNLLADLDKFKKNIPAIIKTAQNLFKLENLEIIEPVKLTTLQDVVYRYFGRIGSTPMTRFPWEDFMAIGLNWFECVQYRSTFYKELLKDISLKQLRNETTIISAFGGYHPLIMGRLDISEDTIKKE